MGRKVHPVGFRLGVIRDWSAKWYADGRHFADSLQEDPETAGKPGGGYAFAAH